MSTAWHGGAQHGEYHPPGAVDGVDDQDEWPPLPEADDWNDWFGDFGQENLQSAPAPLRFSPPPLPTTIARNSSAAPNNVHASLPSSLTDPTPPSGNQSATRHTHREPTVARNSHSTFGSQDARAGPVRDNVASALAGRSLSSVTGVDRVLAGPSQRHSSSLRPEETRQRTNSTRLQQSEDWLDNIIAADTTADSQAQSSSWPNPPLHSPAREGSQASDQVFDIDWFSGEEGHETMAPRTRRSSTRNNAIDLTGEPSSPHASNGQQPQQQPRSLRRAVAETADASLAPRPSKRQKRTHRPSAGAVDAEALDSPEGRAAANEPGEVDLLDLTADESAVAQTIAAQQQSAHDSASGSGPMPLGQKTCIICMESFTDATTTPCGHMYCFECLNQALLAGEKNSERGVGTCPVCRKPVHRRRTKTPLLPIAFMKKSAFHTKGRGKEVEARAREAGA